MSVQGRAWYDSRGGGGGGGDVPWYIAPPSGNISYRDETAKAGRPAERENSVTQLHDDRASRLTASRDNFPGQSRA